ncbi:MAG: phosphoribosylglycinamide formyltransferase [Desulfobacterales bacterium]|jgi:phosphoribosylglycinamide formyltransferase-1
MLRIAALISGSGTNLAAILEACQDRRIDGEVVIVGSDNPEAAGLKKAGARSIDTFVVDYRPIIEAVHSDPLQVQTPPDFQIKAAIARQRLFRSSAAPGKMKRFLVSRAIAEVQLLAHLKGAEPDLLVLAGFMRTLSPYFIDRFSPDPKHPKIMNIHPALLPAFPGTDGYGDTWRYGCKLAGCTVHFIDYGEDTGPIIGQRCFAIAEDDSPASLRQKGLQLEWELYPACIQLFAEGRLRIEELVHRRPSGGSYRRKRVRILPKGGPQPAAG